MHVQPLTSVPDTDDAWPLQSAAVLQGVGAHVAHELHVAPLYPVEHVHVQPLTSVPDTDDAWPLQSIAVVQGVGAHVGQPL